MAGRGLNDYWPLDRRATHALLVFTAVAAAFVFVIVLKDVFTPFFVALTLAYIFNPLVNFGEKLRISRKLSTVCIFGLFLLIISFVIFVMLPSLLFEAKGFLSGIHIRLPSTDEMVRRFDDEIGSRLPPELRERASLQVREWIDGSLVSLREIAQKVLAALGRGVLPGLQVMLSLGLNILLIAFCFFFLLMHLNSLWEFLRTTIVPYEYREVFDRISLKIHVSLSAFFRGRLLICTLIGLITWVGFLFLKVPLPFFFGFSIGFATVVPMLGLVFLVPAVALFAVNGAGAGAVLALLAFYALVQGLEMFVFTPFLLGREVELHALVLVMAILVCGYLFGVIGVLLAVPIASTAKILFNEFIFPSFLALSHQADAGGGDPSGRKP